MANEVEARYLVPDQLLFERLLQLESLGPWSLKSRDTVRATDCYLDTPGKALLHQGWACRLRSQGDTWVVTLKGPKEMDGPVVTRPEYEITLRNRVEDVTRWPRSKVRSLVTELTGGLPLRRLVTIKQVRHRAILRDDLRPLAELSLDEVSTLAQDLHHQSLILECELREGTPEDLQVLDQLLVEQYALVPESRSKLHRALELIERTGSPDTLLVDAQKPSTREELGLRYGASSDHARFVANVAELLFDDMSSLHGLTARDRGLLSVASWLHDVGEQARNGPHHVVSRDVLLHNSLVNTSPDEQRIIAMAAYLHRKKVTPERIAEMLPEDWSQGQRRRALVIAALVRMAAALDRDHTQSTGIQQIKLENSTVRVLLSGPNAALDAKRAQKRSDLWGMVTPVRMEWGVGALADGTRAYFVQDAAKSVGINPWDSMSDAARKTLAFHYQRMLDAEPGTRSGDDPEELHDMRVATRRMRSALSLFKPFLTSPMVGKVNADLRRLGQILGQVRDMDVARDRALGYLNGLQGQARPDLSPLLAAWERQRATARKRMLHYLDGRTYDAIDRDMRALLEELAPSSEHVAADRAIARIAPHFLYVDWRVVRGYDDVIKSAPIELLHQLRIDCKRLRYGLEFMRDVLPPKVVALIPEVVAVQDHLGNLHDAAVAIEMLDAYLVRHRSERYDGVRAYREALRHEEKALRKSFPKAWRAFTKKSINKAFAKLLAMS